MQSHENSTPELVTSIGLIFSLLIAFMVYLLQKTNQAIKFAKNANEARSQFLSNMSHELRTPLNAILSFSQLLELDAKDDFSKRSFREITDAGDLLLALINEILDLAKIETGNIEFEFSLASAYEIMNECISIINSLAESNSVEIENNINFEIDNVVNVDKRRFKQILINLLSNAVKYNNIHCKVIIDYSILDKDFFQILISDSGKGLTEKQIDNLFKPFARFGAENSHVEGTGLGLVISKKLIELMNGSIGVESKLGEGSCFWIKVPLN